jgi:acyl-[acyl-carrier-protein]-phospholipid O-acyltransferase/long-chain-fatty-acid--[acyl-carrier-protein] ligase
VVFHNVDQELIPGFIARMREAGMPNLWIPKSEDFVRIDTIPIMGNGKLDLQALRKLADAHGEAVK